MSESNHFSDRLRDPLNETTRKVRRNLMAASVIGVVLTKVGLVPSKISAFGVEFSSSNQQALMLLLAAAIGYFAINFIVYVYSELTAWQIVLSSKQLEDLRKSSKQSYAEAMGIDDSAKFENYLRHLNLKSRPTFYMRLFIEIGVPIVFAAYSAFALLNVDVQAEMPAETKVQVPANKALQADGQLCGAPSKAQAQGMSIDKEDD